MSNRWVWVVVRMVAAVVLCALPRTGAAQSASGGISLYAPPEGGTPRDESRMVVVGPGEFRVRACAQEGHSVLTHAV